jgi:hypothetical protein
MPGGKHDLPVFKLVCHPGNVKMPPEINKLALKLPRELVSGLLGIKPFAPNETPRSVYPNRPLPLPSPLWTAR